MAHRDRAPVGVHPFRPGIQVAAEPQAQRRERLGELEHVHVHVARLQPGPRQHLLHHGLTRGQHDHRIRARRGRADDPDPRRVSGGENVYPAEVESVMTGHPDVAEVAVVGVPSAEWGESPYVVVVLRPGAHPSEADLISWTRDRLAHYKCPVGVTFTAALARTASGKLQKQAIRSSLATAAVS